MYDYIKGVVSKTLANYVVIECNGVGYKIYTPNPYKFKEGIEEIVYVYHLVREDEESLYGFKSEEEREMFLRLISVKGLGPKMAMPILATGSINGIVDAIERENILYLKKFPKIGEKLARQIILDLKGKLASVDNDNSSINDELVLALESLGYKNADIKGILPKVDGTLSIEQQIKEALKLLLK